MIKKFNNFRITFLTLLFVFSLKGVAAADSRVIADIGVDLVGNGSFNRPLSKAQPNPETGVLHSGGSWAFYLNSGAEGTAGIEDGILVVTPINIKAPSYGIQVIQAPVTVEKQATYKVSFTAKSTAPRDIIVKIGGIADRKWAAYNGEKHINISTNMQKYEFEFTMLQNADPSARVEFWFTTSIEPVWIDDISVIKTAQGFVKPEPVPGKKTDADEKKLENWQLVWSDEFKGTSIDKNKWGFETGTGPEGNGWGNNEMEYYTDSAENAFIENGHLVIRALKKNITDDKGRSFNYTSSRLTTKGKFSTPKYCKIDVMAKLPEGKGLWPAIWMLGDNIDSVPWPACGEIDIMELLGHVPWKINGTIHGPVSAGPGIGASYVLPNAMKGDKFSLGFHKFTVQVQPNAVKLYVDDVLYSILDKAKVQYDWGDNEWVYGHPFFLLLNVAVGGTLPGYPNSKTVFPQQMEVKYVRVYDNKGSFLPAGELNWNTGYVKPAEPEIPVVKSGLIIDSLFENPDKYWVYGGWSGGDAKMAFDNGTVKIDVKDVGNDDWNVQFKTMPYINVEKDKKYIIKFKARSSAGRNIKIVIGMNGGSWTRYTEQEVSLTKDMKYYKLDFTMKNDTDPKSELIFMCGVVGDSAKLAPHTIEISGIFMREVKY